MIPRRMFLEYEGKAYAVTVRPTEEGFLVQVDGEEIPVIPIDEEHCTSGGRRIQLASKAEGLWVQGRLRELRLLSLEEAFAWGLLASLRPATVEDSEELVWVRSPMPGRVVELKVRLGEEVDRGQALLTLEAMKMQNEISSPEKGVVAEIKFKPGDFLSAETPLIALRRLNRRPGSVGVP